MPTAFEETEPTRAEIDGRPGPLLLEFGSPGCGFCRRAQPLIEQALATHAPAVPHLKVADGPGQALGRSFKVKLWPTLVFMRDGVVEATAVRPLTVEPVAEGLRRITSAPAG